jgi:hypothetical protein
MREPLWLVGFGEVDHVPVSFVVLILKIIHGPLAVLHELRGQGNPKFSSAGIYWKVWVIKIEMLEGELYGPRIGLDDWGNRPLDRLLAWFAPTFSGFRLSPISGRH